MAVAPKGKAIMQLRIDDSTKEGLIALAGGERKVGKYLDDLVPILLDAQDKISDAQRRAARAALTHLLVEQKVEMADG